MVYARISRPAKTSGVVMKERISRPAALDPIAGSLATGYADDEAPCRRRPIASDELEPKMASGKPVAHIQDVFDKIVMFKPANSCVHFLGSR